MLVKRYNSWAVKRIHRYLPILPIRPVCLVYTMLFFFGYILLLGSASYRVASQMQNSVLLIAAAVSSELLSKRKLDYQRIAYHCLASQPLIVFTNYHLLANRRFGMIRIYLWKRWILFHIRFGILDGKFEAYSCNRRFGEFRWWISAEAFSNLPVHQLELLPANSSGRLEMQLTANRGFGKYLELFLLPVY